MVIVWIMFFRQSLRAIQNITSEFCYNDNNNLVTVIPTVIVERYLVRKLKIINEK